jgi:hypothetical protein
MSDAQRTRLGYRRGQRNLMIPRLGKTGHGFAEHIKANPPK